MALITNDRIREIALKFMSPAQGQEVHFDFLPFAQAVLAEVMAPQYAPNGERAVWKVRYHGSPDLQGYNIYSFKSDIATHGEFVANLGENCDAAEALCAAHNAAFLAEGLVGVKPEQTDEEPFKWLLECLPNGKVREGIEFLIQSRKTALEDAAWQGARRKEVEATLLAADEKVGGEAFGVIDKNANVWVFEGKALPPDGSKLYTHPAVPVPPVDTAKAVVDAARAALNESFEDGTDDRDIVLPAHLAAALSLRLDEHDRGFVAHHPV